jgi:hypothetical protein
MQVLEPNGLIDNLLLHLKGEDPGKNRDDNQDQDDDLELEIACLHPPE